LTTENCIFCKIISGEIPAQLVAESEHAIAFNDISPQQPVHVLIVPREHHANVTELALANPVIMQDVMQLGAKVSQMLTEGSHRFTFSTGAAAGQTVFHVHGHIMSKTPKTNG
jgi:histidine triad (HIT) family protein